MWPEWSVIKINQALQNKGDSGEGGSLAFYLSVWLAMCLFKIVLLKWIPLWSGYFGNQNSSQAFALLKQEKENQKSVRVDSSGYHREIKVESPWPIVWTFLPTFHAFAPIHYLNPVYLSCFLSFLLHMPPGFPTSRPLLIFSLSSSD